MEGRIIKSTGSWYYVMNEQQEIFQCKIRGRFKNENLKSTNPVALGDRVIFSVEEEEQRVGVITEIQPRRNYIIRKSVHKTAHKHIMAANIDQAVLMVTLTYPKTSLGFIDRFLVSTESFRIPSVILFNKTDMWDEKLYEYHKELAAIYTPLNYICLSASLIANQKTEDLEKILRHKTTLIAGHSGVGKSTLINQMGMHASQKIAEVSPSSKKGIHTTTFAEMFTIDNDSFIIDTPGIKEWGLVDIGHEELSHFFPEMRALLGDCKFHSCTHTHEPKCAVKKAVLNGAIAESRYNSYLSMLEDEDNRR